MLAIKRLLAAAIVPTVLTGASAGLGLAASTGASNAKELIFNAYAPRRSVFYKVLFDDLAKRIKAESKGSITVKIPGASLAPPQRQWQIVTQGVADVVSVPRFSQRERLKLMRIAELPFNAAQSEASSVALMRTYKKFFLKANEFKGVKVLGLVALQGRQFINGKRPIKSIKDFAGLKLWATAGPLSLAVKVTGATAVPAPFPKLFEFASKGTIDGMVITPASAFAAGVGKYSKYMTTVPGGIGSLSFALVMNQNSWNGLSADDKAAVERAVEGLPARFGKANDKFEKFAAKKLALSVTEGDDAFIGAFRKRLAGLTASWLKQAKAAGIEDPQAVLDFYRSEMAKVSAQGK